METESSFISTQMISNPRGSPLSDLETILFELEQSLCHTILNKGASLGCRLGS